MTRDFTLFAELSDEALIDRVLALATHERRATAQLVAALAEVERRKLYLPLGYSSLFVYCTRALHLSEHAAYNRIEAARAASLYPSILESLAEGSITLAAVRLLAPILTPANCNRLLREARFQSKREIEVLVARERPQPDVATVVRRLPGTSCKAAQPPSTLSIPPQPTFSGTTPTAAPSSFVPAPVWVPLAPERYKIQFTASREFHDRLRRAQALLRHAIPNGDLAEILGRGLKLLVTQLEKQKAALTNRPRAVGAATAVTSRHIPAAVKREVWKRDGGRCAFVGTAGRCAEQSFLEFHHVVPFADGGRATTANIELRCRAHNGYEADRAFALLLVE